MISHVYSFLPFHLLFSQREENNKAVSSPKEEKNKLSLINSYSSSSTTATKEGNKERSVIIFER